MLYLNDRQHVFGDLGWNLADDWRVGKAADLLIANGLIEPPIIVSIDYTGQQGRAREYLPWEDAYLQSPEPNPHKKDYPTFFINEVVPMVESTYPIKKGKASQGIGASLTED